MQMMSVENSVTHGCNSLIFCFFYDCAGKPVSRGVGSPTAGDSLAPTESSHDTESIPDPCNATLDAIMLGEPQISCLAAVVKSHFKSQDGNVIDLLLFRAWEANLCFQRRLRVDHLCHRLQPTHKDQPSVAGAPWKPERCRALSKNQQNLLLQR